MLALDAISEHPDNQAVLRYLNLERPADVYYFEPGSTGSLFDEGSRIFYHDYGRRVPNAARCTVNHANIMAHEQTARIFALHQGRLTIALRPDFSHFDPDYGHTLTGETLDGPVDLRPLGAEWVLFRDADWLEEEPFWWAYKWAGRTG
jgi:hypothetical protein